MTKWHEPRQWIAPRTPTFGERGLVIIESDDGNGGDYTHWFPLFYRKSLENNSWYPPRAVVMCPDVNPGNVGKSSRLTWEQLSLLYRMGWEINSHGYYHLGLGKYYLTEEANEGSVVICADTEMFGYGFEHYEYIISDGVDSEVITILLAEDGVITINDGLTKAWGIGSWIELSQQGKHDLLQQAIDALNEHNIPCKHHVYPYHAGSEHKHNESSINIVGDMFLSGRGRSGAVNDKNTDLRALKSKLITASLSTETIDAILAECKADDKVGIFYGHGETSIEVLNVLEYLIDKCMEMGIRIGTRQMAYEKLTNRAK